MRRNFPQRIKSRKKKFSGASLARKADFHMELPGCHEPLEVYVSAFRKNHPNTSKSP